ncbi:MAG: bifunctional DNA primase/polymerase [Candidatus Binataceae bacterium]|jgi:hypothetical protein
MSTDGRMLRAALAYAERFGFAVFPCKPCGKEPLTPHGFKDATNGPAQIDASWKRWPSANVSIATGAASGVVVLDVDPRHGGDETLAALEAGHGKLPDAPTVLTGGGGLHQYFKHPGDVIHNSAGTALGPGLDIRGDGGYVIAPPSIHPNGKEYLWEVSSRIDEVPLPELPAWLLELLTRHKPSGKSVERVDAPATFEDGTRNDYLYRFARSQHARHKLSYNELLPLLIAVNQQRCRPPLDSSEVQKIATNAYQQGDRADFKAPSGNPDVERLAALPALEYDTIRKQEAKRLSVRVDTLDAEVEKERKRHQAEHPEPKPLPQWAPPPQVSLEPVDGAGLIADMIATIRRFVMLDETAALVASLWVLFTWVFEHTAETNPFLRVISPTPQCGKSTLFKVLSRLARCGWIVASITPSAFTRTMDRERHTLFLDEGDAFLHENELMRNVLDAASDPDTANHSLSVKSGDDWAPVQFNVYVPIAIASIGRLRKMHTVEDRSIALHLKRATPTELKQLAKGRRRELKAVLEPLAGKCARWAADNLDTLNNVARPTLPDQMSGREQDKWEPLVAIADAIGPDWGERARAAAVKLSGAREDDSAPLGIALLADISGLFDEMATDRFSSKALCEALAALEGRPWGEYGKAQKPVTQNQLARLLKSFLIVSHTIRLPDGSTPKGYTRSDFEDDFTRYLPDSKNPEAPISGNSNRHNATTQRVQGGSADFQSATKDACGASKNGSFPNGEKDCGGVADRSGMMDADRTFSSANEAEIDRLADDGDEGTEL